MCACPITKPPLLIHWVDGLCGITLLLLPPGGLLHPPGGLDQVGVASIVQERVQLAGALEILILLVLNPLVED